MGGHLSKSDAKKPWGQPATGQSPSPTPQTCVVTGNCPPLSEASSRLSEVVVATEEGDGSQALSTALAQGKRCRGRDGGHQPSWPTSPTSPTGR